MLNIDNFEKIIELYWSDKQIDILIEECAELIQALQKFKRYKNWEYKNNIEKENNIIYNIKEEIADVQLTLDILIFILKKEYKYNNLDNEINTIQESKINKVI
jgi:NTP pyrophosphatase (non-canonical NTP hydrolase)